MVCLTTTWLFAAPHASAADPVTIVAIGESNNDLERAELLDLFGVVDSDEVMTVTVDETLQAWEGIFDLSGVDSAYSSTALTCDPVRSGIAVTTSNIEVVPPELYALALITAGMTEAELVVAAPQDAPALGMTALTGVFKTWDQSPCADMGSDPNRRQIALEQLALVAEIGQAHGGADGVGSVTDLVLAVQQAVVGGQVRPEELGAMISARAEQLGVPLTESEEASLVGFFDDLTSARLDWGGFADTWTVEHRGNGASVMMQPGEIADPSPTPRAVATGVGGAVETIPSPSVSPTAVIQATAPPQPTATPRVLVIPSPTATGTAAVAGAIGPTDPSGPPAGDSSDRPFPWWVLLGLIPLALGVLVLARRHRSAPLIARRAVPAAAAATVRQGPAVPVTSVVEPSMMTTDAPVAWRRFTVTRRPERPNGTAPASRRVVDPHASGD